MARTNTNSGAAGVTSVSNVDGTLTIAPNTGLVIASVNQAHDFAWTGQHTFNSHLPTSTQTPISGTELVTKTYVDLFLLGLQLRPSCLAATVAALPANTYANGALGVGATLTANANGALPLIDTVSLVVGNRVLIKNEVAQLKNGIYVVTDLGSAGTPWILTRATDYDQTAEVVLGSFTPIIQGAVWPVGNRNTIWAMDNPNPITMGTTIITFSVLSVNAGNVVGTPPSTDNAITRYDGTTGLLIQNSDITISDVVGGIVTIASPSAMYFTTTTLGYEFEVDSGGDVYINAGALGQTGGSQGHRVDIRAGQGGPTGLGGPLIIVAGQGGSTSGNAGPLQLYGGQVPFGSLNSNGGDIWLTPGNKQGTGTIGKLRVYASFGANFSANIDASLIAGSDKTFTFPNISGTHVVSNTTTDDNTIPRYDGTSGKLVQDGELTLSDITFGTVILQTKTSNFHISPLGDGNELRLFIPNTTAGSAGPINIYGGNGFGAGSGSAIEVTGGGGGATGVGGYVAITGGQGGSVSGAGATVSLTGGSALAGNSNGGNVDLYGGLNTGSGVKGHIRILDNPFSTLAAQFDASLIITSTKTFTFPNLTGTFALTANNLGVFAATTSAQLAGVITDETGTGVLVFNNSPVFLGTPTAPTQVALDNSTKLATTAYVDAAVTAGGGGFVPITRTLTINGTLFDLSANRSWSVGDALVANPLSQFAATTSAQLASIITNETGTGSLVFGTSPTLVTPNLGTPSVLVLTNASGLPLAGITGLAAGIAAWLAAPTSANLAAAMTNETGTGLLVFNTSPTFVTPILGVATGTSLAVTGAITSNGVAGIGYAAGAGGAVIQLATKATAVTLNKICGRITMSNANLANNAEVSFTLNNTTIAATDVIYVNMQAVGTVGGYTFTVSRVAAGSCVISVSNVSGGALAEAIVLNFAVIKSVIV